MRVHLLITAIIFGFVACEKKENKVYVSNEIKHLSSPILSKQFEIELDKFIEFVEFVDKNHNKKRSSILIEFGGLNKPYVSMSAYYKYYDYSNCNGYFYYKGKIISLYGLKLKYSKKIIDKSKLLTKDEIPGLNDDFSEDEQTSEGIDRLFSIDDRGFITLLRKA